jgi:hypothetical protein
MHHRQLRAALGAFAEEAAWQLASDTADGHEVPFEVVTSGRRGAPLYCYRPLTADFIAKRQSILARLETYPPAVHALSTAGGLEGYVEALVARGVPRAPRARAELALRAFLGRVFHDSTDFVVHADRLERAFAELEDFVTEGRAETVIVAPVLGVVLGSAEIPMGDGLALVRGDVLDDVPVHADVLAVLRWEAAPGDVAPLEHARVRLRRLITALRLYDGAAPALGAAGWTRTSGGPWSAVPLGLTAGRPHGVCHVLPEQEDELRAFCSLLARRTPRAGEVAWALARFEAACDQPVPGQALTDHLLALRALLEPEGPASGRLSGRVAALCALPDERGGLAARIAELAGLERRAVTGTGLPDPQHLQELVDELAGYGRAILRDLLCGHLDADVRRLADTLIDEAATATTGAEQPTPA